MKSLFALVLALTTAAAIAKPSPVEPVRSANPIALGAAGATLERNYFRAPEVDSRSGICRFESNMFGKVRLTQSCR